MKIDVYHKKSLFHPNSFDALNENEKSFSKKNLLSSKTQWKYLFPIFFIGKYVNKIA